MFICRNMCLVLSYMCVNVYDYMYMCSIINMCVYLHLYVYVCVCV